MHLRWISFFYGGQTSFLMNLQTMSSARCFRWHLILSHTPKFSAAAIGRFSAASQPRPSIPKACMHVNACLPDGAVMCFERMLWSLTKITRECRCAKHNSPVKICQKFISLPATASTHTHTQHSWPPRTHISSKKTYTHQREIIEVNVACNKSVVLFSPNLFSSLPLVVFILLFTSRRRAEGLYQPRIIMNNGKRYHSREFSFFSAVRGVRERESCASSDVMETSRG